MLMMDDDLWMRCLFNLKLDWFLYTDDHILSSLSAVPSLLTLVDLQYYTLHSIIMLKSLLVWSLLFSQATSFSVTPSVINSPLTQQQRTTALSPLGMGRAAAVREKTKGKTDLRKTKTNAIFGKRIIMAVKQGGSPEPTANTLLANIIRLAKNNNVPVDVSPSIIFFFLVACAMRLIHSFGFISPLRFDRTLTAPLSVLPKHRSATLPSLPLRYMDLAELPSSSTVFPTMPTVVMPMLSRPSTNAMERLPNQDPSCSCTIARE